MESLRENIIDVLEKYESSSGRKISEIKVGDSDKASVIADCYEIVIDENSVDTENFKIVLNNKNRVQFSIAFTVQSACDNGANSAILTFAAVKNGEKWILSDNYIPYINTGK